MHDPAEVSREIVFLSSCVMACVPQYLSAVLGDLSRGSGQLVPKTRSALEHLTRSRAVSRRCGSFSCRFLSWPVRERPPACLYAVSGRDVARSGRFRPATPVPPRVSGSVQVAACPSVCSLCSRRTICPGNLATERPEARGVPAGHLAPGARTSRRHAARAALLPVSERPPRSVALHRAPVALRHGLPPSHGVGGTPLG